MKRRFASSPLLLCGLGFCVWSSPAQSAEPSAGEILYVRRLAPLFHERCLSCHGNDEAKIKGDFDMSSREAIVRGGESGLPGIVMGDPQESPLYLAVTRTHHDWEAMPPKEADKLYQEQIAWIGEWITAGAPRPEEERIQEITRTYEKAWAEEDGIQVATSGGLPPNGPIDDISPRDYGPISPSKSRSSTRAVPRPLITSSRRLYRPDCIPPRRPSRKSCCAG